MVGGLIIAQARTLAHIVDQVFLQGAALDGVARALLLLLAIIVVRAILSWGSEVAAFQVAARVKADLRERVFDHLMALGPAYLRGERTGELTNTLVEGIEQLEAYFSQYLPQLVLAALIPLAILAFVFPIDVLSGVVLLVTAPLIPFFMILIGKAADALTRRQYTALSLMSAHFLDVLQGLTTLKLFGRSREQIETIARVSGRFRDATLNVLRVAFLSAFALEMIATISTAILAVEVGLRLLSGSIEFEQAFFVLVLAPDFYLPLRLLGTRFHAGMSGVAAAQRIFEVLDTPCPEPRAAIRLAHIPPPSHIQFQAVHYAYDGGQRSALNGVSFDIIAGQRLALVGATGAGKSTLAHLLLRFIEPQRGAILIDHVPLADIEPQAWREHVAWVPQLPYLFDETVAANIGLARSTASMADVIQAAQLALADEFIRELPQGYETPIGERGARLSGGQAQRIALARAFLKDAPLLIMDEGTAQLDVETEALIQAAIDRLLRNRTTLIITHRLSTARRADHIVVLDAGRVVESGAHDELMGKQGVYHRMVSAMAS
jgi:ATP-binding cassette subfamily C protein CydD